MKVKDLIKALKKVPGDYDVEIGKFIAIDTSEEQFKGFQIRLDYPMIGLATNDEEKEVNFVVGGKGSEELCYLLKFGQVTKMGEDDV